ncbi:MAG: hypothetical protein L6Q92_06155 [Phycisphaerae bacterium]|nr:hypothetical protein [Phycisphaerae bacterium]
MSAHLSIRELLHREVFEPFRIVTTSGESCVVRNPDNVALLERRLFIAAPKSDRWAFVEYLHVNTVESLNGHIRRRK